MKTFLTKFLAISSVALLMLASCKKDGALVTNTGSKPGELTASATQLALDKTKLTDTSTIIKFSFTAPTYSFKAAVTNTIQIDSAGDNWAKPTSVTLGNKVLSQGYNTTDFNSLLLKIIPAGKASQVNIRVQHALSSTVVTYSNIVTITVTPFNLTAYIYVVGQFNGYSTSAPDSLVSATGNGVYKGIINFPAGDNRFLVLPAKNFNTKYATTASPTVTADSISYATEFVSSGGSDLYAPSAPGEYVITLNTNTNTISVVPADYYSVIGDAALGWNGTGDDTEMKFVNDGSNNWVVTLPLVSTGSFKVRQDDAWTNSWGIPKSGTAGDGIANTLNNSSNNNISIAASGNYKVTFTAPPTSFGGTALATTTYTVTKQ